MSNRLLRLPLSRSPANLFQGRTWHQHHSRLRHLVRLEPHPAGIAVVSRIVRAATGPVEIAVAVLAVAEDADEAVAAVLDAEATAASVANFLRPSTLRRIHPRITPGNRERRKGTFQSCCPGSLSRSSSRGARRILWL